MSILKIYNFEYTNICFSTGLNKRNMAWFLLQREINLIGLKIKFIINK